MSMQEQSAGKLQDAAVNRDDFEPQYAKEMGATLSIG